MILVHTASRDIAAADDPRNIEVDVRAVAHQLQRRRQTRFIRPFGARQIGRKHPSPIRTIADES